MIEMVDYFNEDNSEKLGTIERSKAKELWKRWVSVWVINNECKILLQQRSENKLYKPNAWETCVGHIMSDEEPLLAAIREIKEEAGIDTSDLISLGIPIKISEVRAYVYPYLLITNNEIGAYKTNKEVQSFKYVSFEELTNMLQIVESNNTIISSEYIEEIVPRLENAIQSIQNSNTDALHI